MTLLETKGLTVRFGGHTAVSEVDIAVDRGQIVGLIGPNGAGKTTTFNLITGVLAPTGGRVMLDGSEITKLKTHKRSRAGIGRTFQRLEVFGSLSVRDNIKVAGEIRSKWSRFSKPSPQMLHSGDSALSLKNEVELILERLGLVEVAHVEASALPTGQARLVELGRALCARPKVLLLDEPASGLDETETEGFGELLRGLVEQDLAILLVEHDVPLVMNVCDSLNVLDFGQIIASGTPAEIQANQAVLDAYLGAAS